MRQTSVGWVHTTSEIETNNRIEEKENVMRKSINAAIALTVALTLATPAFALPGDRGRDRSQPPSLTLIIKKFVKKLVGGGKVSAENELVIPIPKPSNDTEN